MRSVMMRRAEKRQVTTYFVYTNLFIIILFLYPGTILTKSASESVFECEGCKNWTSTETLQVCFHVQRSKT